MSISPGHDPEREILDLLEHLDSVLDQVALTLEGARATIANLQRALTPPPYSDDDIAS